MEEMHFSIDVNFLCDFYLQKHYERLTSVQDEIKKRIYIYPLFDEIFKENNQYLDDLDFYIKNILQFKGEEFILNTHVLEGFANYYCNEILMKRKSYLEKVETNKKNERIIKTLETLERNNEFYVFDKLTEKIYYTSFGEHFKTIIYLLCDIFGEDYVCNDNNWDILNNYINDNLILGGTWYEDDKYRLNYMQHMVSAYCLAHKNDIYLGECK